MEAKYWKSQRNLSVRKCVNHDSLPCVFQVTDVVDSAGTETTLGRYCGNTFPSDQLTSTGNKMLVTFRSDNSNNYNGFAARFVASEW